jgi:hypothetical protein
MISHYQQWPLAGDILFTPDLATGQETEEHLYYYFDHIIEPGHYSTLHKGGD